MAKGNIRLVYRKLIDINAGDTWSKCVFDSSYAEYLLQVQFYDQAKQYPRFSQLLHHIPQAEKMHFLVSAAVTGYLQQLNGMVPDLTDSLGKCRIAFTQYRFEIIESDIHDKRVHQVGICFYSEPFTWVETIHNSLLLAKPGSVGTDEGLLTRLVSLQPMLSIYSYKEATL